MWRTALFTFTLLAIEFLDEFVYGAREAAWPLMRTELGLSYAQVGLLLSLPGVIASWTTLPVIGIPMSGGALNGVDALYATVQMLAVTDADLAVKLAEHRAEIATG